MARIWKEKNNGRRFGDRPWTHQPPYAATLDPREDICVSVCSFTFHFESKDEIEEYIAFFTQKTHPTSRRPMPEGMDRFDRWHAQRWFEKLPMYLQEESKREKVLKALKKAVELIESGKL
jgi:hypothetical protein